MSETIDPHRLEAERAAMLLIDSLDTNILIRPHVWQVVSSALDVYEDAYFDAHRDHVRPGWAILREDGTPWLVLPSRRIARQQRRALAELAEVPPRYLRIVRTEYLA